MSDGEVRVRFVLDPRPFVEALERLADFFDPLGGILRQQAMAHGRGERPCGRPHDELVSSCPKCRAAR